MGTSEKRADYIQSPVREEYKKTTLGQKGGTKLGIPGNLVSLFLLPVTIPGIVGDCPRSPKSQTALEKSLPKGPGETSDQGEIDT